MRYGLILLAPLVLWPGCGKPREPSDSPLKTSATSGSELQVPGTAPSCSPQPFAESIDLPEASGATLLADGSLMIVGDSNTDGAFAILDAGSGELLRGGKLDLDGGASDDLEGLSRIGDVLYAITSSGWMRQFRAQSQDFQPLAPSYPLAGSDSENLICASGLDSNCAQNYEGLCLRADAGIEDTCAGFAAAKESGRLICLRLDREGHLQLDASNSIEVAAPKSLSGCHFDNQGRIWFGTNLFAGNSIGYVEGWQVPQDAKIMRLGAAGIGFGEAIAVAEGDQVFRFSDTAGSPSLLSKYICR